MDPVELGRVYEDMRMILERALQDMHVMRGSGN